MHRISRSVARSAVSVRHSPTMIIETLAGSLNAGGNRVSDTNKSRTQFWAAFQALCLITVFPCRVSLPCFLGRQKLPDGGEAAGPISARDVWL
jgi:hypothetical protein